MTWRDQYRKCVLKDCRADFRPKREDQRFCCPRHAVKDRVARHRSRYINAPLTVVPEKPLQLAKAPATRLAETATPYFNPHGPTPWALQGDDYQLEYYDDGYPRLPACLDRRAA